MLVRSAPGWSFARPRDRRQAPPQRALVWAQYRLSVIPSWSSSPRGTKSPSQPFRGRGRGPRSGRVRWAPPQRDTSAPLYENNRPNPLTRLPSPTQPDGLGPPSPALRERCLSGGIAALSAIYDNVLSEPIAAPDARRVGACSGNGISEVDCHRAGAVAQFKCGYPVNAVRSQLHARASLPAIMRRGRNLLPRSISRQLPGRESGECHGNVGNVS